LEGIVAGSVKANEFSNKPLAVQVSHVSWISTFRSSYVASKNDVGDLFYEKLSKVLQAQKIKVQIIGFESELDLHAQEVKYFSKYFESASQSLNRRISSISSYELIKLSPVVMTDQSSLGYESLALGCKTGFMAAAPRFQKTHRFGKPLEFGEKGPFWTNDPTEDEIARVLNYLLTVSDEQWERDSGWIRDQLMVYDYGNTKIRTYVEGVLADSLESN
jgi:surface carbohydrate biosynthesis protein